MASKSTPDPIGILPHRDFLKAVHSAQFDAYRRDPKTHVSDEGAFKEMQGHIARLYHGVQVEHSFADPAGNIFDCIPIEEQPSLRGKSHAIAKPPDISARRPNGSQPVSNPHVEPQLAAGKKDKHGNAMLCPPGTIPIRRITLDELARFRTLRDFLRKVPPAVAVAERKTTHRAVPPDTASTTNNHRYAYAQQDVANIGAHNFLNVWSPAVGQNQEFSLAQHWYSGGSGSTTQTVEVGWQVFPKKYGHSQPVLFIYWTADNYGSTGSYNLDGAGFVQTNSSWTIGGALSPVSTTGGTQYEIEVSAYLNNGNWWIYVGGTQASDALGYYPASLYSGGQMASNATQFLCGGETVCDSGGWGDMGSGALASAGWQQAAYQRDIYIFPTGGNSAWANLLAVQPSPSCYTINVASATDPWNIYFFFGGPGGSSC